MLKLSSVPLILTYFYYFTILVRSNVSTIYAMQAPWSHGRCRACTLAWRPAAWSAVRRCALRRLRRARRGAARPRGGPRALGSGFAPRRHAPAPRAPHAPSHAGRSGRVPANGTATGVPSRVGARGRGLRGPATASRFTASAPQRYLLPETSRKIMSRSLDQSPQALWSLWLLSGIAFPAETPAMTPARERSLRSRRSKERRRKGVMVTSWSDASKTRRMQPLIQFA
jgi:hypothetical protein